MFKRHIRCTITFLLILTLANVTASFCVLHALHRVRDEAVMRVIRMTAAINTLERLSAIICTQQPDVCAAAHISTQEQRHLLSTSFNQVWYDMACREVPNLELTSGTGVVPLIQKP